MPGYDNPITVTHQFGGVNDFGADADNVFYFQGPAGKKGRLRSIMVETREAFACTTTAAYVAVGTGSDADAYAKLNIADGTADDTVFTEADDTDAIIAADLPADTAIKVTCGQSVDDSSDTGQGVVSIIVDWY